MFSSTSSHPRTYVYSMHRSEGFSTQRSRADFPFVSVSMSTYLIVPIFRLSGLLRPSPPMGSFPNGLTREERKYCLTLCLPTMHARLLSYWFFIPAIHSFAHSLAHSFVALYTCPRSLACVFLAAAPVIAPCLLVWLSLGFVAYIFVSSASLLTSQDGAGCSFDRLRQHRAHRPRVNVTLSFH